MRTGGAAPLEAVSSSSSSAAADARPDLLIPPPPSGRRPVQTASGGSSSTRAAAEEVRALGKRRCSANPEGSWIVPGDRTFENEEPPPSDSEPGVLRVPAQKFPRHGAMGGIEVPVESLLAPAGMTAPHEPSPHALQLQQQQQQQYSLPHALPPTGSRPPPPGVLQPGTTNTAFFGAHLPSNHHPFQFTPAGNHPAPYQLPLPPSNRPPFPFPLAGNYRRPHQWSQHQQQHQPASSQNGHSETQRIGPAGHVSSSQTQNNRSSTYQWRPPSQQQDSSVTRRGGGGGF
uniref:Uncharacterized protein n=1 Tax=Chromera velia CCMP2878 TaxID=1169474 RepID=A0A0G4HJN8_9ALVE|eukprot:Cvel_28324.t1-p1 / transcript=Cvel_28324.t1 / gene=Cvel_28324 / organism=Chromera_velia_CCMP2878 / gene_product=hypothetical protein / transcript_product=hypothetical protein / location=Cvel_scaffold3682:8910-10272(-) / protein_length=286 / sequence_SO=supercontig / SO=protein_coding / is_pseudo=false